MKKLTAAVKRGWMAMDNGQPNKQRVMLRVYLVYRRCVSISFWWCIYHPYVEASKTSIEGWAGQGMERPGVRGGCNKHVVVVVMVKVIEADIK